MLTMTVLDCVRLIRGHPSQVTSTAGLPERQDPTSAVGRRDFNTEASHKRGPTGHCPGPRLVSGIHQRPARVDHQQQRKTLCWRLCTLSRHHRQKRYRPSTTRPWCTWEMGGQVVDGIQCRQVLCHARNSLQTQNTTPVHTTQPNTHTCQTLQIPRSNPLRRPNLAHPHIQRSRWRLQNTQFPPQNSPHRIAKHQSPCIQSTCPTQTRIRALCMGSAPRQVEKCVRGSTEPSRTICHTPMAQYQQCHGYEAWPGMGSSSRSPTTS